MWLVASLDQLARCNKCVLVEDRMRWLILDGWRRGGEGVERGGEREEWGSRGKREVADGRRGVSRVAAEK